MILLSSLIKIRFTQESTYTLPDFHGSDSGMWSFSTPQQPLKISFWLLGSERNQLAGQ